MSHPPLAATEHGGKPQKRQVWHAVVTAVDGQQKCRGADGGHRQPRPQIGHQGRHDGDSGGYGQQPPDGGRHGDRGCETDGGDGDTSRERG
ncbi:hypothetical protein [Asanoa ishikariensis]|uniref:hypothetical protein n=1 Tax=Asanoa ishikariensis TaxID=137265 RepID=UPI00115F8873|nr:hypothetical protein [Asanoa ishikariensis]